MDKLPTASIANFDYKTLLLMSMENSYNASCAYRRVGEQMGAFGYVAHNYVVSYYFEDKDAAVLAVLTYA